MPGHDGSTGKMERRHAADAGAGEGEPEAGHATGEDQAAENRENDPPA
jgi:hypothetical protein